MRTKYRILYYLMYFPLVLTLVLLPFFPKQIPAHYDVAGNINRWGSKYEQLILPIFTIIFGYFMVAMVRLIIKKTNNDGNEKAIIVITSSSILIFDIMCLVFLYKAFFSARGINEPINIDISQLIFIITGVSICLMGNILPKCKMNSIVGLRTKWSMKNEKAWSLSQRYGGILFVLGGISLIIINLFLKGISSIVFSMAIFFIILISCIIISYISYRKSI